MWETRDIIGTVKDYGQGKFVEIKNVRENLIITNEIFPGFPISSINASIVSVSSNNVTDISKFKSFKGNSFVPPASANHTLAKRFDVTSRHFFLDISHHLFHFLYKIALTAFNVLQTFLFSGEGSSLTTTARCCCSVAVEVGILKKVTIVNLRFFLYLILRTPSFAGLIFEFRHIFKTESRLFFDRAYYNYEEAPNPKVQWFYDMLKSIDTQLKYTMELRMHFPSLTKGDIQMRIREGFSTWFREEMLNPMNASSRECLKNLSRGVSKLVKSCNGYFVNRFRFYTQEQGFGSLTYNCGVWVKGLKIHDKCKLVELHIKRKCAGGYDLHFSVTSESDFFLGCDPSFSNASKFLWKVAFGYHYPFGKNTFQTLCLLELPFQFGNESFYSHLAFKCSGDVELDIQWIKSSIHQHKDLAFKKDLTITPNQAPLAHPKL
ncbi:hypothetical protein M9H77_30311 [Catharanthus roseus]|uniref:Uncharacterized protein n=1 Tax=Catharanthus roseus TaxID=4058 RepID=A0ACB9ZX83_CATRO|nr:hypothetical protein M9H77_30311 [Catharanthus roseus]